MLNHKNEMLDVELNEELSIELNIEELEQRLEMANSSCTRCCVSVEL